MTNTYNNRPMHEFFNVAKGAGLICAFLWLCLCKVSGAQGCVGE
jgi:hypothetical protein